MKVFIWLVVTSTRADFYVAASDFQSAFEKALQFMDKDGGRHPIQSISQVPRIVLIEYE